MTSERDQRIMELATGFALGDLGDDELKEFYALLRDPAAGEIAGQVAWETLGTMVDLRTQAGSSFQDKLYRRLADDSQGDPQFSGKVRSQAHRSRPRSRIMGASLPSPFQRRWAPWLAGALLVALLLSMSGLFRSRAEAPVAQVVAVTGNVTQGDHTVMAGQTVDRRPLLIANGAQLTLSWANGSQMTLEGSASAVASSEGLTLLGGQAWWSAVGALSIGLPDRAKALPLPPGSRGALSISDNHTTIALSAGRLAVQGATLAAGQVLDLSRPGEPYAWQQRTLSADTFAEPGGAAARWRLTGIATWKYSDGDFAIIGRDRDGGEVVVRLTPGNVALDIDGRKLQRAVLGGEPLDERAVELIGDGTSLTVVVSGQRLEVPLSRPIITLAWVTDGAGELDDARFSTGPDPEPPPIQ